MVLSVPAFAQIGRRFPSEKKVVPDPVTGVPLTFLTTGPSNDAKIYQTHPQWTADGKWIIFRSSDRVPDQGAQAFAVNEDNGVIVQVTDKGFMGMLCVARKSMKLYIMRNTGSGSGRGRGAATASAGQSDAAAVAAAPAAEGANAPATGPGGRRGRGGFGRGGQTQIIEIDLAKLFADSEAGTMKPASNYERVCGTIPTNMIAGGDMALDANEDFAYFRATGADVGQHLPPGTRIESGFGPRNMGAGPAGLRSMNLKTGEIKFVVDVPFQIGHVQTNPWVPGEIVFCWETGGKAPQRTWTVMADGTGLRPLYPEALYEWITHEAVITSNEVAIAILGHRRVGANDAWGVSGTAEHPTGVGIVNLRTREMRIIGQVPLGNPGRSIWHVNGSPDGRWAVADDFMYRLWLIDRHTGEMMLLADMGHMTTAADHIHPTFSADGTKIEIQTAMLAPNGRALDICVVPVPQAWLERK
jgi:oligogalacturonide lyase